MKETVYAYQQTKLGRTPAQIRAGIERGDVDGGFKAVERGLVLGIEKARIAHGDERRFAAPLHARTLEIKLAVFGEPAARLPDTLLKARAIPRRR